MPDPDDPFAAASRATDFMMVYIEEAHAEDEWPISSGRYAKAPVRIMQPRTASERVGVAREFLHEYTVGQDTRMDCVVDDPEQGNPFEKAFAPWPLRLFVVEDGRLTWIAQPKNCEYDVALLREFLLQRHKTPNTNPTTTTNGA
jgi:hypothetical protein